MAVIKSSRTEGKKKMSSNSSTLQIALKRCIHLPLVCVGAEGDRGKVREIQHQIKSDGCIKKGKYLYSVIHLFVFLEIFLL